MSHPYDVAEARGARTLPCMRCGVRRAEVPFFYKQTSAQRPGQPGPSDLDQYKQFPRVGWNQP